MELLLLENEQLRERLRLMQAAQERARATIGEYIYECDREKDDLQLRIKTLKELIFKLTAEVNLIRKKADLDDGSGLQVDEQGEIKAGTVEKLVESLYMDNSAAQAVTAATAEYSQIFMLTYRSFATAAQVLELLIQGFNMLIVDSSPTARTCRLRIGNYLKKWLTDNYHDFNGDQSLLDRYAHFVNTIMSKSEPTLSASLKGAMAGKLKGTQRSSSVAMFTEQPPKSLLPRGAITSVVDINPKELARQLTLMHYNLCKAIEAKECLGMAWTKKDKEQRAPNLLRMIHNFNLVSKWVAATIVRETNMTKRVNILSHFIHTVEHLRELNNFNAIFQIIGGLGNSSVFRLTKTFTKLRAERTRVLEEMRVLTNPHKSWANYRKTIHEINPPCVPFLGIYQTDLTFIEDGNPDKFSTGLINFKKCRLVASVIAEIQQYQQKPYNLLGVSSLEEWIVKDLEENQLDEKQLYDLSLLAEPRGA